MKRRYFYFGAAIITLFAVSVAIFVGCSADRSSPRMETGSYYGSATSITTKNPVAADPTARRVVESQPNEELWIIGRADKKQPLPGDELIPGSGVLATQVESKFVPIPLKHTDVKASIAGYIATVDVTQQYENPYNGKIEAAYAFPLPDNAAV